MRDFQNMMFTNNLNKDNFSKGVDIEELRHYLSKYWINCGERMPYVHEKVLVFSHHPAEQKYIRVYAYLANDLEIDILRISEDPTDLAKYIQNYKCLTYWMPFASAPRIF
jgi:hypothetical protein